MNKAPSVQAPAEGRGLLSRLHRRHVAPVVPAVATPITEEEALAEIAAQREAAEQARRAKEARWEARQARRAEKAAAAAKRREAAGEAGPWFSLAGGRFSLSLTTGGCVAVVGLLCALMIVSYSLGRRSRDSKSGLPSVAAVGRQPALEGGGPQGAGSPAGGSAPASSEGAAINPDLSELLKKPALRTAAATPQPPVSANRPARVGGAAPRTATSPEDLNYLQIESFLITRERDGEQVAREVADVRRFLAGRGVRTFARRRANGFVLFCEEGMPAGREHAAEREAFRRRIEELGTEYRRAGGLYQFKGCLFVSYSSTRVGDPG